MSNERASKGYFLFDIQVLIGMWQRLGLYDVVKGAEGAGAVPQIVMIRMLTERFNSLPECREAPVPAGHLYLYGLITRIFRYVIDRYTEELHPRSIDDALEKGGVPLSSPLLRKSLLGFVEIFPGADIVRGSCKPDGFVDGDVKGSAKRMLVKEMLLLSLAGENPAIDRFRRILDDAELAATTEYRRIVASLEDWLATSPPFPHFGVSLMALLRAPMLASPGSLAGQADYIRNHWSGVLPQGLMSEFLRAIDIFREEGRSFHGGPGRPTVLEFLRGKPGMEYPEYERYSMDSDWMPNVVMIAKMTYVWLGQLSKKYGREINRLDQVPDEELDILARWGFTALWLIGLWERSPASERIKRESGNPEAAASAYSLYDYAIAADLGGDEALYNLKGRCLARGIRLASDMVPNHTGIYSRWVVEHPDWFVQLEYPPYPVYRFNGPDLSCSPEISINIEDGYWDRRDAAVVFKHYDHRNGRSRFIYHGNDGTSTPWNDTAQLNYLIPDVREAVIRTIIHVARQFPIIRFDAAMTLAKKHYQRLWYPQPGHGSGVPSRAEHGMTREEFDAAFPVEFWREVVDRVAAEAPGTLLLAEAFWLMEGYFVRTLGMHRVYNSAFMNMLKMEENAKYRQTVKNVLEFDHRILQRFVNFMNNPDERTAVEQFGKEGKYFGACVLLVTMPGLPMFGHGQVEGFHEKYGMEYRRAYWDEHADEHFVAVHEAHIFPLMKRRYLFSGSENFVLYDFFAGERVNENVFAYSNGCGDQRGLILYNNSYEATSGWIRVSSAMAAKNDSGETFLLRKKVGDALGCNPDGRYYYTFRDCCAGLEYLRSGREICESGLFSELGGYEYRAFIDFCEIRDDDFGSYGRLSERLGGRGVACLEDELKRVRHGSLHESFVGAVAAIAGYLENPEGGEEDIRTTLESFYGELNRHTDCSSDPRPLAEQTMGKASVAEGATAIFTREGGEANSPLSGTHLERLLLAGWLVMHGAGTLSGADQEHLVSAAWFDELGLCLAFRDLVCETPAEAESAAPLPEETALLLRPLLRWQHFLTAWDEQEAPAQFTLLMADPGARELLGCHRYSGSEWFNRERFVLLLHWLCVTETIGVLAAGGKTEAEGATVILLRKTLHHLMAMADAAGYRVDRFLELLQAAAPSNEKSP